jgi:hypothetical protein
MFNCFGVYYFGFCDRTGSIVFVSASRIYQNFIGLFDTLEFIYISALVWMMSLSQNSVLIFDLFGCTVPVEF